MTVVTLLTDFGLADTYVGVMKGVILQRAPTAVLVDLTHGVPPQDVATGARMLADALPCFPDGTVHVAVVDPGVGTSRRGLAVRTRRGFLVGPDNGLLDRALAREQDVVMVQLDVAAIHRQPVSSTFHGRDVFAPVAGLLAAGVPLEQVGSLVTDRVHLPTSGPRVAPGAIHGRVVRVDAFGNLVTDIEAEVLATWLGTDGHRPVFRVGSAIVAGLHGTFADVAPGAAVAYAGSDGTVELAVNRGHAARDWACRAGDDVTVERRRPG